MVFFFLLSGSGFNDLILLLIFKINVWKYVLGPLCDKSVWPWFQRVRVLVLLRHSTLPPFGQTNIRKLQNKCRRNFITASINMTPIGETFDVICAFIRTKLSEAWWSESCLMVKDCCLLLNCDILARISVCPPERSSSSQHSSLILSRKGIKQPLWKWAEQWLFARFFSAGMKTRELFTSKSSGLYLRRVISPSGGCVALVSLQSSGFPPTAEMLTFRKLAHVTVVYATPDVSQAASLRGRKTHMLLCSLSFH